MVQYRKKMIDTKMLNEYVFMTGHEPMCDFCADPHPLYVYAASRTSTGHFLDCWRWCACWSCSEDIREERWEDVTVRMAKQLRQIMPGVHLVQLQRVVHMTLNDFFLYSVKERAG